MLAPLNAWRKVMVVIGGVSACAGLAWFKLAFSFAQIGLSVLVFFVGCLLLGLAYAGVGEAKSSE
jgi:uncharacterized integral membrane protein